MSFSRRPAVRLNTVELRLPSLRERREAIPALAAHLLAQYAAKYRRALAGLSPRAIQALLSYPWPGNVRELDHTLERGVLMASRTSVEAAGLGLPVTRVTRAAAMDDLDLEAVEAILVRKALARAFGNITQAAERLGLSRGALYRRLEKHGIAL